MRRFALPSVTTEVGVSPTQASGSFQVMNAPSAGPSRRHRHDEIVEAVAQPLQQDMREIADHLKAEIVAAAGKTRH
jgi:hypothetical protein